MKACWKDRVIAESPETVTLDGHHYFPPGSVDRTCLRDSDTHTYCPSKGLAYYYDIEIDGETQSDAAWCYPEPEDRVGHIAGYIAFWLDVSVVD